MVRVPFSAEAVTRVSTGTSFASSPGVVLKATDAVVGDAVPDSVPEPLAPAVADVPGLPLSAGAPELQAVTPSMARTAIPESAAERMLDFTRVYPSQTQRPEPRAGQGG
ncbi:hypothetical protein GCM10009817_05390 [Terrabacter lapilli]|uniref:Uncharacterized protein n=1 Tax=Terrabacter lapilli TaxID=436231 RepID=A0ABN2RFQ2_9MICO